MSDTYSHLPSRPSSPTHTSDCTALIDSPPHTCSTCPAIKEASSDRVDCSYYLVGLAQPTHGNSIGKNSKSFPFDAPYAKLSLQNISVAVGGVATFAAIPNSASSRAHVPVVPIMPGGAVTVMVVGSCRPPKQNLPDLGGHHKICD
jgi:hypothetical protein